MTKFTCMYQGRSIEVHAWDKVEAIDQASRQFRTENKHLIYAFETDVPDVLSKHTTVTFEL